jgi:hypothetical protein
LATAAILGVLFAGPLAASAAYQHHGESDAPNLVSAYPSKAGTKLDSCTLCHTGGSVTSGTKTTVYGSCQWCHYTYGYVAPHGDISATLNPYGKDYLEAGRSVAALKAIEPKDSDGDGFTNVAEITATRYPGDAGDDPTKVVAPFVVFGKDRLEAMPQHSQFLLMNTTKSGDYYAEYSGVVMQDLLKRARVTSAATKVTAFAPDGYAQGHPLDDSVSNTGKAYAPYVNGTYPAATYFYDPTADKANGGWCDYSSPGAAGRGSGDPIEIEGGLRLLLALRAEGKDLVPGALDSTNKLKSGTEGPFRVITPQKLVGPPDQASTASDPNRLWAYSDGADHNAGFSTKSTTVIRVEPLPAGTTDIDVLEAGWSYIDQEKIVVYGALEQLPLVHPADGGRTPFRRVTLTWTRVRDPDPAAKVAYTLEYTSGDPVTGPWTATTVETASLMPALGPGASFLTALMGEAMLPACSGGWDDLLPGFGRRSVVSETVRLERHTKYHWRVTADGPNSHNVSPVWSFTTGG